MTMTSQTTTRKSERARSLVTPCHLIMAGSPSFSYAKRYIPHRHVKTIMKDETGDQRRHTYRSKKVCTVETCSCR